MPHHIYKTQGFVLGSTNVGEAHRYISLFTRDLGLVHAHARSVREERSKLRFSLQNFSYGDISLVRGREIWRITGAQQYYNVYRDCLPDTNKQVLVSRLFSLVRRMVHGEEKNDYLFSVLIHALSFLREQSLDSESLKNFEYVTVLRILHALGYVSEKEYFKEFAHTPEVNHDTLASLTSVRSFLVEDINRALVASQL